MFKYCPECKTSAISFVNNHFISCSQCEFVYFHNTAAAVAVIINVEDEILFTVRAKEPGKGQLDLPGGFVDHHENLEEALSREIVEELSINISPTQLTYLSSRPNIYHYKNIKYHTLDAIFSATLTAKPKIQCDESEVLSTQWIKKSKINLDDLAFTSTKSALLSYLT